MQTTQMPERCCRHLEQRLLAEPRALEEVDCFASVDASITIAVSDAKPRVEQIYLGPDLHHRA